MGVPASYFKENVSLLEEVKDRSLQKHIFICNCEISECLVHEPIM
jgi:hypothetical protein